MEERLNPRGGWLSQGTVTGQIFCLHRFLMFILLCFCLRSRLGLGREKGSSTVLDAHSAPALSPDGPQWALSTWRLGCIVIRLLYVESYLKCISRMYYFFSKKKIIIIITHIIAHFIKPIISHHLSDLSI